jgi:hypothetical protein
MQEEWTIRKLRVHKHSWTEAEFSLYIKENFDMHIFVCHPHQGASGFGWNPEVLYQELRKHLYSQPGYPSADQMFCPIWTQNKAVYLHAIPEFVNKTDVIYYSDWLKRTNEDNERYLKW